MSFPMNLQTLPPSVFTAGNVRGRTSVSSPTSLSFPKSRSALWDGSPAGDKLRLHLCSYRKPQLVLLEKALRLAQRHVRHNNKPHLHGFFLGSMSVDSDEEGVTLTLDRFDPGRKQTSGKVPSALLPGDVQVPCLFTTHTEAESDSVVQSEAALHHCFKELHQFLGSRQTLDLSQLIKVRGHVVCSQLSDAAAFDLSWSAVCPSISLDVQPVRAIPIIPTALLRSLTSVSRPLQLTSNQQRGFLTMDQTRKLLLLLESDPKASTLPLVGLWLSGVTHIYNPQVWAWCLRFLFSSSIQDRALSDGGCFLIVVFSLTHSTPQFFQCRVPRPTAHLGCQLLTVFQSVTLYQVALVDGQSLKCELGSDDHSRQMEVFTKAQSTFTRASPRAANLSVSDQDSGVEDEDLSPRPSPSPHAPAQQIRRVQPSVPELSLLIDSSSNQPTTTFIPPPRHAAPSDGASFTTATTCSAPTLVSPSPPHLHSTPNSNLQQPCTCCSTQAYDCASFSSPGLHAATAPPPSSLLPAAPPPSSLLPAAPPPSSLLPAAPPPSSLLPAAPPPSSLLPAAPPPSSLLSAAPPPSSLLPAAPPPSSLLPAAPPPSSLLPAAPSNIYPASSSPHSSSTHGTPMFSHHPTCPPSLGYSTRPVFHDPSFLSTHLPALPCVPYDDSPSPHLSSPTDPTSPLWLQQRPRGYQCCNQVGGAVPSVTYQLLLHQDQQLRLLQAQVQLLLEAQRKLQSSSPDTQIPRSTASIAVGTGASLFWGCPNQSPPLEVQTPCSSSSPTPCPSSSSVHSAFSHVLSVVKPVGEPEEEDVPHLGASCSPSRRYSINGQQSPVLEESMCRPADEQQSFYLNLMTQLTSRLQEPESKPETEEERSRRKTPTVVSDHSQSSLFSQSFSSSRTKEQSSAGDPVVSATLRQLRQLGVDVDAEVLTESDRNRVRTVESNSTLASINPAAVVSRLSVSDLTVGSLLPGGSVDLSLEANAIALRYLSDSQLSRLSLGGSAPQPAPGSSCGSVLSPSNMSVATRKYMKRYGLIEEEDGEDEDEQEEIKPQKVSSRRPLPEALNAKLLPQSQLIRDLRPKMQLLVEDSKRNTASDKENCSVARASICQTEGSVGNILDLSRLRQLPKLF